MIWALGALAAVWAVLMLRLGLRAEYRGGRLALALRLGPAEINLLPAKKRGKSPKKASKKPPKKPKRAQKPKESQKSPKPKAPRLTAEDARDAVRTLLPALGRALGRVRRGVRLHPFTLSVTLGGQGDPAEAAWLLGRMEAAVWAAMPYLERAVDLPDPRIHAEVDFSAAETAVEGEAGVSLRLGTLAALGFGLMVPAAGWLWRYQKRRRERKQRGKDEQGWNIRRRRGPRSAN